MTTTTLSQQDRLAAYDAFLRQKFAFQRMFGFDVPPDAISPILKPHQAAIVRWGHIGPGGER
ncbi:MAG: hypothetical protein ABR532_05815 [Candidatus Dormibacteria bacterium]